ncbi:MAG: CooT family nickel-binding protein [Oscillospiraceae bacterium]|nr:CooT family nickel-binding protein [Oscillospiraceae bacterium]
MCLSTVYEECAGERKKLCEYVSGVSADGDNITMTDIMGVKTVVRGSIRSLDLVNNVIIVEAAQ